MKDENFVSLSEFQDIDINGEAFELVHDALDNSIQAAISVLELRSEGHVDIGVVPESVIQSTALLSVNTMIRALDARCTLAAPPESIDMTNDRSGQLIYRCQHNPPHEWDLNGNQLP